MTVSINEHLCIGCGVCVAMHEDVFILDDDTGFAKVIVSEPSKDINLNEVIETCPVSAISQT